MQLYFAYGSNLSLNQMSQRCPAYRRVEAVRVVLQDYRWFIYSRGYANIAKQPMDCVEGALYELTQSDEASLDRFEGVSKNIYEKKFLHVLKDEVLIKALVYFSLNTERSTAHKRYAGIVLQGARDANLSDKYIERVLRPQLVHA